MRADHVFITIEDMSTAARTLLAQAIRVAVSVNAPGKDAAAAIAASLTEAGNTELEKAGLPPATLLAAAAVEEGGENTLNELLSKVLEEL